MAGGKIVRELLSRLQAVDPQERDLAAAELGDLFEADYLKRQEFEKAVPIIMQAALAESDPDAKESLFDALSSAATLENAAFVNWEPIAAHIKELTPDCLEHALVILSFTGDVKYRPVIEPFLRHPSKDIRQDARDALRMLSASEAKHRTGTH
jgi:HEAT repeat protein